MENEFMTPEEVANLLKVSTETVWRWCRAGLGTRYGHQYRITRADLEAWGKQNVVAEN